MNLDNRSSTPLPSATDFASVAKAGSVRSERLVVTHGCVEGAERSVELKHGVASVIDADFALQAHSH